MQNWKLLGLQMVLGLRFGAGAATSGTGAPVAPALAAGLHLVTLAILRPPVAANPSPISYLVGRMSDLL